MKNLFWYSIRVAVFVFFNGVTPMTSDYSTYHRDVIALEGHIVKGEYNLALDEYESLFRRYDFVFVRDYKIASQLAWQLKDTLRTKKYIAKGLSAGWAPKDVKRTGFLKPFFKTELWKGFKDSIGYYNLQWQSTIDSALKNEVHEMFKRDQKMAFKALLRFGDKAHDRYYLQKFAPHSEAQMNKLDSVLTHNGYPGEKFVGNDYWAATVLSHHNSISWDYNNRDTLFTSMVPQLKKALIRGEMSPYEYALVEDWRKAIIGGDEVVGYGFLVPVKKATINDTNGLRAEIGLRSVQLRNQLVGIEEQSGMNFYLPDWIEGPIHVE